MKNLKSHVTVLLHKILDLGTQFYNKDKLLSLIKISAKFMDLKKIKKKKEERLSNRLSNTHLDGITFQ